MLQTGLGRIETVFASLERTRPSVAAHSRRVAVYSTRLASQFGVGRESLETIRLGALLHDIGKIQIPARILTKQSRPNKREWRELRFHPELGIDIAHRSGFDEDVCDIVLSHHERWDGSGYPDGAAGQALHWTVRVVSVMDAFDAITGPRPYREALSVEAARALISREAGRRFCPWVVSGLLAMPVSLLQNPALNGPELFVPDGIGHRAAGQATTAWRAVPCAG